MKKLNMILISLILFMPTSILAYSDYVIPGGNNVGIEVKYDGLLVVGFYKINNKYNQSELEVGDIILKVNDKDVNSLNDLVKLIEENYKDNVVELTIKRNDKIRIINLPLIEDNGELKTGLYIKDSITGIGTISYIDPNTNIYGALGHEIIESTTSKKVEVKDGSIFDSSVSSIDRSSNGSPGTKNAKFNYNNKFGNIIKNTTSGIYGNYIGDVSKETVLVGKPNEISLGKANLLTVLENNDIKEYEINITKIDKKAKIKNIYFEITDKDLISKSGGIVQGMSGSPIMQDGKIIGAVTHVVTQNVKTGYGIFITTMLEEGEKEE